MTGGKLRSSGLAGWDMAGAEIREEHMKASIRRKEVEERTAEERGRR